MKRKLGLRRLLDRKTTTHLFDGYTALLESGVGLFLFDNQARQIAGTTQLENSEITHLWERVCSQGAFKTPEVAVWPITVEGEKLGMLLFSGSSSENLERVATLLVTTLEALATQDLAKRAIAQETLDRYREVNVLYNIGETLGACLDLDRVCELVLNEAVKLTHSRCGAVLLYEPDTTDPIPASDNLRVAASISPDDLLANFLPHTISIANQVVQNGKPQIINDFYSPDMSKTPLVCAPLRFQEDVLGVVLLIEKLSGGDFSAGDEKLLSALAIQAASSIENARLFEDVKRQRDEIATMKSYMDNIFASIASGVITTDMHNVITTFNRAAESILDLSSQTVLNRPYQQVLDFLNSAPLPKLIDQVRSQGRTFIDYETNPHLPKRGPVHLNLSLSRLRNSADESLGVTIVVDDVTEKKKFEREQRMVRRYLPPELVDSLPDLEELKLSGERQIITTLFADIRGFTGFSEANDPETVVQVINRYFALAAQAVREHQGIVDKYLGDAVMAVFNTPLLERERHAWDAVRAAWKLKQDIDRLHQELESSVKLTFGIGICTGEAVVGNVGATDRVEYTAIGDAVNVAKRLQENASGGQIIMSRSTWEQVQDDVQVRPLPAVTLKGRQAVTEVFELLGLK